ncbi:MAG: elongation factor 4 [Chloroflexi bacterium]|nr:elongation factor 4 [Chloroflexota bacterium]
MEHIRNFCIVAHIDHGKSTLADRILELTGAISHWKGDSPFLDQMELERERGITIKAQAVRLSYRAKDGQEYELNLIDTPGHVDFTYEVSRSLAACEGVILVVDASQGVQAQTVANVRLALEQGLALIPVINKIDLPNAQPELVSQELHQALGFSLDDMLFISAKDGKGVKEVLEAVVRRVPSPSGQPEGPLRALIFDSSYDPYKGVIAYVRLVDGRVRQGERLLLMSTGRGLEALEVGVFHPSLTPVEGLESGEVGYIATGLKDVQECQVGDTVTLEENPTSHPLPGYKPVKPMVFAGLYPTQAGDYSALRDALGKLKLNDASLSYEPETSKALGFGFRCGFLGTLHLDIVQERLEREYGLALLMTAPSVAYRVSTTDGKELEISNPSALPPPEKIGEVREPWMRVTIPVPQQYIGPVMELVTGSRGEFLRMEYLVVREGEGAEVGAQTTTVLLEYRMPLAQMLSDFYDQLKASTQGYASMDYSFLEYRAMPLVKLDILVNGQVVDALSLIAHRDEAQRVGRALAQKLMEVIPRQLYEVAIQAAIGGKVIARETVRALRKDVLAKCYGGDITRKMKLLEKQAAGKRRMKRLGKVEIPQEAFTAVLKLGR